MSECVRLLKSAQTAIPFSTICLVSGTVGNPANWSALSLEPFSTCVLFILLARLGVFSAAEAWVVLFSAAFAAAVGLFVLSGGQLALLLDCRLW